MAWSGREALVQSELIFGAEFPSATRDDWLKLTSAVLKGAAYDSRLVTRSYDGLMLDALPPRAENSEPVEARAAGAPWRIAVRADHPDLDTANRLALDDLVGGASLLTLVLADSPTAYGFGLQVGTPDDLDRVLSGVDLGMIGLRIEGGADLVPILAGNQGMTADALDVSFGLDPLGTAVVRGVFSRPWAETEKTLAKTAKNLRASGIRGSLFSADGRPYHAAGAGAAQELAAALATALAYIRALADNGIPADMAASSIEFTLAADANQIETTAKFRAIRLLWSALMREIGSADHPTIVHAETAWRMMTRLDPHTNILRATIAGFAAGVGGADSMTILPFSQAIGLPDGFARRLARNTHAILIEEASIHRVADPAAGAGAFEAYTDQLAERAWDLFLDIERAGGMAAALASGWWQSEVRKTATARAQDIASGATPIVGTTVFPPSNPLATAVLQPVRPAVESPFNALALPPSRLSEPHEASGP